MLDPVEVTQKSPRAPWNKGKLIGAKPLSGRSTSGQSGRGCRSMGERATSPCSTWPSTASYAVAMSWPSRSRTLLRTATSPTARLVSEWIASIGLDPLLFGTHSLRRTKATLIYRRTGNLRAVQILLGHTKIESTVRYLGIEVDDALAIAEQIDV